MGWQEDVGLKKSSKAARSLDWDDVSFTRIRNAEEDKKQDLSHNKMLCPRESYFHNCYNNVHSAYAIQCSSHTWLVDT